jgi:hypothetical protein
MMVMEVDFFLRRERVSRRQERLFAVACAKQIWDAFTDERWRKAIEVAESFAEERATKTELEEAHRTVDTLAKEWELANSTEHLRACGHQGNPWSVPPALKMAVDCTMPSYGIARGASYELRHHFLYMKRKELGIEQYKDLLPKQMEEPLKTYDKIINALLPHYKSISVKKMTLSIEISRLANAVYDGENSCALHDALIEARLPLLAEHFSESYHPKGCQRLDMILGR